MTDALLPLIVDFLEWLEAGPRDYRDVMDAWRTSCPRLTVWEDALERHLVRRDVTPAGVPVIALAPAGRTLLQRRRKADPKPRQNSDHFQAGDPK